ncbi:hypothetical protein OESDEN_09502 [Oesophagostomum dentatum]|uniref:Uncharacterized protein n=1 Tax=Oesophagostomum dentatum TaxID=61180 RepID=A0A0B1T5M4_OESDE|nr:hypothetical protein OESDEN_09502 [Oesophagostomum dentatum]
MFHLFFFLCFIPIFGYGFFWNNMITILLGSDRLGEDAKAEALTDFVNLLDDFGDKHGIHYNRRTRELLYSDFNGLTMAKYGLKNTNCEQVQAV